MKGSKNIYEYFKKQWYFKYWVGAYLLIILGLIVVFVLPYLLPTNIVKNGQVSGFILRNQVWEGEIKIVGDTFSFPVTHIKIKPGTKIIVLKENDRFNLVVIPWFLKKGINTKDKNKDVESGEPFWDEAEKVQLRLFNVNAIGNKENPIILTSSSNPGSRYDINLIKIYSGDLQFVKFSNYRRLEVGRNILIADSKFKNTGDCAICITQGDPVIEKNTFENSQKYFIDVAEGSPFISNNKFLSSFGDGIIFNGSRYSKISVNQNYFDMAGNTSIRVLQMEQSGSITQNFFNTGMLELPCSSKVKIFENSINVQIVFKSLNICPEIYEIGENFWGMTDINEILKARIIGITSKNRVKIPKALKNSPVDSQILAK